VKFRFFFLGRWAGFRSSSIHVSGNGSFIIKGGFPLSEMIGIDFVIVMVHCHLVNSFTLSKLLLMHSDWLECSTKYFASKPKQINTRMLISLSGNPP